MRALGSSAGALYGGKAPPLSRRDPRIRGVPFPTRRPTYAELERVYQALASVHVYGESAVGFLLSRYVVSCD